MNNKDLEKLLVQLKNGKMSLKKVRERIACLPYHDLEIAKLDTHRELRKGFPEVILGSNKSLSHLDKILGHLCKTRGPVLITKLDQDKFEALRGNFKFLKYHPEAKIAVHLKGKLKKTGRGKILVITAGTSDIPVAEEAFQTCRYMGNDVEKVYDVGVAGIHRLFDKLDKIRKASVIVVVAGMEGALASVISGLTSKPVIAVPTSVGYGASFKGLAALLGMLNACSPGIGVVNIDNGFGAGYLASVINKK
jgi:pyridinium-3,5-biscarboxylic acid mononucleotide synthase